MSSGLDVGVFESVIENGSPEDRQSLASQLADFLAAETTTDSERQQIVPIVLRLSSDPVTEVRRALALRLVHVAGLHADIVFSVISDDDEIALPFLSKCVSLDPWQMLAVLRVGDGARQAAIAGRPDLSAEARAHVVRKSPLDACLALFDNQAVELGDGDYRTLYGRFGNAPEMTERLLACPDLPPEIRIAQAKRASNRMHQLMAERGWIAANDAAELVADAEETAVLKVLIEANDGELARVVPFMAGKAMLTPSIIVRAACLGEMKVAAAALAHLSGIVPARARELMAGRSFKSLHGRSGLPQSCFGILQAACDVAREEREEGIELGREAFGRRLIENLMTRYETMPLKERAKHLEVVGRFAEDRVRLIARRLKADLVRAA